jgi:hypothetical protein
MSVGSQPLNEPVAGTVSTAATHTRWLQLGLGPLCMMSISSPQYVWTLMTKPLTAKLGLAVPEPQATFSLIPILRTFSSPFQRKLIGSIFPLEDHVERFERSWSALRLVCPLTRDEDAMSSTNWLRPVVFSTPTCRLL